MEGNEFEELDEIIGFLNSTKSKKKKAQQVAA